MTEWHRQFERVAPLHAARTSQGDGPYHAKHIPPSGGEGWGEGERFMERMRSSRRSSSKARGVGLEPSGSCCPCATAGSSSTAALLTASLIVTACHATCNPSKRRHVSAISSIERSRKTERAAAPAQ